MKMWESLNLKSGIISFPEENIGDIVVLLGLKVYIFVNSALFF